MGQDDLYLIGEAVKVGFGDKEKGGIIVGYGTSHARSLLQYSSAPESVYIIELAVPVRQEGLFISTIVAHPYNVSIGDVECSSCGEGIDPEHVITNRNYVYDDDGQIHYTDGVNYTCCACSK